MLRSLAGPRMKFGTWAAIIAFSIVIGVSAWARLRGIAAVAAMSDTMGPWWSAMRWDAGRPHAAPYGWGLLLPYAAILPFSNRLWDAAQGLLWCHALIAPVGMLAVVSMRPGAWPLALLVGLGLAVDPGLLDTAISGAEAYLAPIWIGGLTVWALRRVPGREAALGPLFYAMAIMNHPLAVCALPLLLYGRKAWGPWFWGSTVVSTMMLLPQLWAWRGQVGSTGDGWLAVANAVDAYLRQGGPLAAFVGGGILAGLSRQESRRWAAHVLASLMLMLLMGVALGYLRDHHLRILSVPMIVGWGGLKGWWRFLPFVLLRWPTHPVQPPGMVDRDGTLGLVNRVADTIETTVSGPLLIDRAWFSGGPVLEPSAVMMDLHLRGWGEDRLRTGGDIVLIVAAERDEIGTIGAPGQLIVRDDRFTMSVCEPACVREWSSPHCESKPKLGGAWDAVHVLQPELTTEDVQLWWACAE